MNDDFYPIDCWCSEGTSDPEQIAYRIHDFPWYELAADDVRVVMHALGEALAVAEVLLTSRDPLIK